MELILERVDSSSSYPAYSWTSPCGREFIVTVVSENYYLLTENRPIVVTDTWIFLNGKRCNRDVCTLPTLSSRPAIIGRAPLGPSCPARSRKVAEPVFAPVHYESISSVKSAILAAVGRDSRFICNPGANNIPAKVTIDPKYKEMVEEVSYWQHFLDVLNWTPPGQSERFTGMSDMLGVFTTHTRDLLLSFNNNPCLETWLPLSERRLVAGKYYGWEIWAYYDNNHYAPDECITASARGWPDPKLFESYLRAFIERERSIAKAQLARALLKLESFR